MDSKQFFEDFQDYLAPKLDTYEQARKGNTAADQFLRLLYRDGYLEGGELDERLGYLRRLQAGELKPGMPG